MMRRIKIAILVIVVLLVLLFSTFGSSSVCVQCGCRTSDIDYQLPFISVTYFRQRSIQQTPFSQMANELGFVESHSHDWKFMQGIGNGICCALGNARFLLSTLQSSEVVQFLENTKQFRGDEEAHSWFQIALDVQKSRAFHRWLTSGGFPPIGFATKNAYELWRNGADPEWAECLEAEAKNWPTFTPRSPVTKPARPVRDADGREQKTVASFED